MTFPPKPGPTYNPLVLPEHVRKAFASRLLLQAPRGLTDEQIRHVAADLDSTLDGLPPGAAMALFALSELADQGNQFAKVVFEGECRAFGLFRSFSIPR